MTARPGPRASRLAVDLGWPLLLVAVLLGPALLPGGVTLLGDMVFVPRQPWKDAWLGLDGSVPRAVPMDALLSVLTAAVPGEVLQRVLLLVPLTLGGWGAARLVPGATWYARAAAATVVVWNPWVGERLLLGQWAILAGYATLPWAAAAGARLVRAPRTGWSGAGLVLVAAAVASPSTGLLAALVLGTCALVTACAAAPGRGRATARAGLTWAGLALVANLPWLLPAVVAGSQGADVRGGRVAFAGFAARAESDLGVVASVLSLGGTWKAGAVPDGRTSATVVALAGLLAVAALAALAAAPRDAYARLTAPAGVPRAALLLLGGAGLVLALLPTTGPGLDLLVALERTVPGAGVLRDSQRWLAPLVLPLAVGAAVLATRVGSLAAPGREALGLAARALVVVPVLLLPGLAWGVGGTLHPVSFPPAWDRAAAALAGAPEPVTVVLPWRGSYRGFAWNPDPRTGRPLAVLDPAPRFLPGTVLVDDRVLLGNGTGRVVAAEDPRSAAVARALAVPGADARASALRDLGVTHVLVEEGNGPVRPPSGRVVVTGDGLRLLALAPRDGAAPRTSVLAPDAPRWGAVVGLLPACVLLVAGGGVAVVTKRRLSQ